ncbi:hypothetical protein GCM10019059_37680 [Camelimonas fluminis]|uniref:Uncharacterized protein n=1 Tax=Camelimonas fluminis TaxID=1576911 RepID=A0ABV7UP21_9HYPH|nr:hypothetical protein [Camelimonas fluminis]GHE74627.1 hypothetical protein GCM10019059_37680 [Camelimonas fluminis]
MAVTQGAMPRVTLRFTAGIPGATGETSAATIEARAFVAEKAIEVGQDAQQVADDKAVVVPAAEQVALDRVQTGLDRAATGADRTQTGIDKSAAQTAKTQAETARDAAQADAKVYASVSAGLAATADGDQFIVPDGDRNVRYRRDSASVATKLTDYPTAGAVEAVPAKTDIEQPDAEILEDMRGAIVRRTDAAGELYIPNMNGQSVQAHAATTKQDIHQGSGFRPRDIWQIETGNGEVAVRLDSAGGMFLPGIGMSVQAALNMPVDREIRFPTDDREKLHPAVKPLIADLVAEGRPYIDPPRALVPNLYNVPDSIVSAFSVPPPSPDGVRYFATPHYPGHLVHPFLLEMRKPVLGYRYLFADTPHGSGGAKAENPCLFGTNDLNRFDILPGVSQPLGRPLEYPDGTWNADVGFTYDPRNGELVCFWRGGAGEHKSRSTWNGLDWTPEIVAASGGGDSPAILYDPIADIWHLWAKTGLYTMGHWTGPSFRGPWVSVGAVDTGDIGPWHFEVKYIGTKFVMLLNQHTNNNTRPSNLYLGISSDGHNFTFGPALIQAPAGPVYKGTFEVLWDGPNLTLVVGWNSYTFPSIGVPQHLYIQKSNTVDVNAL